jgi:hypothetical protein
MIGETPCCGEGPTVRTCTAVSAEDHPFTTATNEFAGFSTTKYVAVT